MLLPSYFLLATLPLCIAQVTTSIESSSSVQAGITDPLDLNECNSTYVDEKPFKCKICDKEFIQPGHMNEHYRQHSNEKPFKCYTCGNEFSWRSSLKRHNRIHTDEKPFKCDVCLKEFNRRCSLNNHYRIHTGETPFKCNVCGKGFNQNSNLRRHKKTRHKDSAEISHRMAATSRDDIFNTAILIDKIILYAGL